MSRNRKLILLEFNEVNWRIIDPLLARGLMPELARMLEEGVRAAPVSDDLPPFLEPWVTWVTVHTGQPRSAHGVSVLEPPPETLRHRRSWEIIAEAGRSYGIFATPNSWPPRNDAAFFIPGNFSKDAATHPGSLRPIQELNVRYSRDHNPLARRERLLGMAQRGAQLLRFGLRPATVAVILRQLAHERIDPQVNWKKVSLQPMVNLDFFEHLWRKHRPDFATFHTNHCAHYMHRYWRAHDPRPFPEAPSEDEVNRFGPAITFGHQTLDQIIGRVRRMADQDTVIMIASSLGQQPYVSEEFLEGIPVTRIRDIGSFLGLLGVEQGATATPLMSPQWNLSFASEELRVRARESLEASYIASNAHDTSGPQLIHFQEFGSEFTISPAYMPAFESRPSGLQAVLVTGQGIQRVAYEELFAQRDDTSRQGQHEPTGLLALAGPGVRRGVEIGQCSNIDLLPTMLALLDAPAPSDLPGRALTEAFAVIRA
jgi:hypothetical protein